MATIRGIARRMRVTIQQRPTHLWMHVMHVCYVYVNLVT